MKFFQFLLSVIVAIIIIIADYKFNAFYGVKNSIKLIITPIQILVDSPFNIYQSLNTLNTKQADNQTKSILLLKAKEQNYNALLLENQQLNKILGASYRIKNPNFVLARITKLKQSRLRKQVIINQGSNSGVVKDSVVLSADGVLGRIISVSKYFSTIRLITDPLQYTPAINQRNGERGIIKGIANNNDKLIIKNISPKSDIKIDDIFMTSGIAGFFNNNYPVAKVIDIKQSSNNFINIILEPVAKINSSVFVLIDI